MSLHRDLSLSRVPLAGFVAIGTGWGGFAAATPALKAHLSLSEAELGQALFFGALGAVLSMALAPRIIAWTGRGRGVIGAALVPLALGFACVGLTQNFAQFAMAIFLTGASTGFIDVIINARISSTEAHGNRHLMSLNHGCFSLAYALAALVMGLGREMALPLSTLYALLGGLVLAWALLTLRDPGFEQIPPSDAKTAAPAPKLPAAVPLIGLMILLAFFAENSTEIWAALHIEQTLGGRAAQGALGPTMLGLTMAVGRFSGQGLAKRFGTKAVMNAMAPLGALGGIIAATATTPLIAYIGFGLLGFGISTLAPLAFNLAGRYLNETNRSAGIARMSLIGYMGFFCGPPAMGLLADALGLRAAFGVIAAGLATMPLVISQLKAPPKG